MKRFASQLLLAVCALACSACASTAFESTWKSPDAKPLQLRDRKVAAVFVSRDPMLRRLAEEMARDGLIAESRRVLRSGKA